MLDAWVNPGIVENGFGFGTDVGIDDVLNGFDIFPCVIGLAVENGFGWLGIVLVIWFDMFDGSEN